MKSLIEGYRRFREAFIEHHEDLFKQLANGQSPEVMVIACSDSRIAPSLIFSARPGEIFSLRNIANLVPPYSPDAAHHSTSAAIEFAVKSLKVRAIVVMGHSGCGGVHALLEGIQGEFIGPWMSVAAEARDKVLAGGASQAPERLQYLCEHETIKVSLRNLHGYPWVAEMTAKGRLVLTGCYFDIEQGRLYVLDEKSSEFVAL